MRNLMYIVFFDEPCPLCNKAVHFILKRDRKDHFYFAPLGGETAKARDVCEKKSLVLLHDGKKVTEGKAVLRICWLLGGKYRLIGWLSYLPSEPFDFIYRFVAKFRHRICKTSKEFSFEGKLLP